MGLIEAAKTGNTDAINNPPAHKRFEAARIAADHGEGKFALAVLGSYRRYMTRQTFNQLLQSGLRMGCTDLTDQLYDNDRFKNPTFQEYLRWFESWIKAGGADLEVLDQYERFHDEFEEAMLNTMGKNERDEFDYLAPLAQAYDRTDLIDLFDRISARNDGLSGQRSERVIAERAEEIENDIVMARGPYYQGECYRDEALNNLLQHHDGHVDSAEVAVKRANQDLIEVYEKQAPDALREAEVLKCALGNGNTDFVNTMRERPYVTDDPEAIVREGITHEKPDLIGEVVEALDASALNDELNFASQTYRTKDGHEGLIHLLDELNRTDAAAQSTITDAFMDFMTAEANGSLRGPLDAIRAFERVRSFDGTLHGHPAWQEVVRAIGQAFDFETSEYLYRQLPLRQSDITMLLREASLAVPRTRWRFVDYLFNEAGVEPQGLDELIPDIIIPQTDWRVKQTWVEWLNDNTDPDEIVTFDQVALNGIRSSPAEGDVAEVVEACLQLSLNAENPVRITRELYELCDQISDPNDNFLVKLAQNGIKPGQQLMEELHGENRELYDELFQHLRGRKRKALNASLTKTELN